MTKRLFYALSAVFLMTAGCPIEPTGDERYCFGDGMCRESDGNIVDHDGNTVCDFTGTCGDRQGDAGGITGDTTGDSGAQLPADCQSCTANPPTDTDGDCILDSVELPAGLDPNKPDTDGDGVWDGCEDLNYDGIVDQGEMDPQNTDTDGDGLDDGIEDADHDGRYDLGETNPVRNDSDYDGILDGDEDANQNGQVDAWIDENNNGCYDAGIDTPGESNPRSLDSDFDGIPDDAEDQNLNGLCDAGETCLWVADTDCDGIADGKEDGPPFGVVGTGETDPLNPDTDGDGLSDGCEDTNGNGAWEEGLETHPLRIDTDGDGLLDGLEDANQNCVVDPWVDRNTDGCYTEGIDTPGETNPRLMDSDGDDISDGVEDRNRDGICDIVMAPDLLDPSQMVQTFRETCAYLFDTDCDGLGDGVEDRNHNGRRDIGELDPKRADTDLDGLTDGCPAGADPLTCEDKDNDGFVDVDETNPLIQDTDGDGLLDGCEVFFDPTGCTLADCSTDPLNADTDADGLSDGEEDSNSSCSFEPNEPPGCAGDPDIACETDPRIFDPKPLPPDPGYVKFQVCSANNLKAIAFAKNNRTTHDYQLAMETELDGVGTACLSASDCAGWQTCDGDGSCTPVNGLPYLYNEFGRDLDGGGFVADNQFDAVWGHTFQSPAQVYEPALGQTLDRDIYGFLLVTVGAPGDDLADILRQVLTAIDSGAEFLTADLGFEAPVPAHDDLPAFPVLRAQQRVQIKLASGAKRSAFEIRNDLIGIIAAGLDASALVDTGTACPGGVGDCSAGEVCSAGGQCQRVDLADVPVQDPVHPNTSCPNIGCYNDFTVYIGAVQRPNRTVTRSSGLLVEDPAGEPEVILVVTVTYDDRPVDGDAANYADRLTRLQDLTGGSAVARFEAMTSNTCEKKPQNPAVADMLWVIDDSRSMQQIIDRVQQAAAAVQAALTANAAIVQFRVAMTTTNPSIAARSQCDTSLAECTDTCSDAGITPAGRCETWCADQTIGCLKICPNAGCLNNCANGWCDCQGCDPACTTGQCVDPANIAAALAIDGALANPLTDPVASPDVNAYPMPGGGGTFYYEDSEYLDCVSSTGTPNTQLQDRFYNGCDWTDARFSPFYTGGGGRVQLTNNGGFLGSAGGCNTSPLSLVYDVDALGPSNCVNDTSATCDRLTADCSDGPTVLASQMCDLIRSMGGLPCDITGGTTSSARPHSAPEHGSRSARRLISKLLPALPLDYSGGLDTKLHLRLNCSTVGSGRECPDGLDSQCSLYETCDSDMCQPTGNCPANGCDPGDVLTGSTTSCTVDDNCGHGERCAAGSCVADCAPVPLVTIILSDEEDYYFKDECRTDQWGQPNAAVADIWPLPPAKCRYVDGDPSTSVDCTAEYCLRQGAYNALAPFDLGWPAGYDPDTSVTTSSRSLSGAWRSPAAPECSADVADNATSCIGDPCPTLNTQTACDTRNPMCVWMASRNRCENKCAGYAATAPTTENDRLLQIENCKADVDCRWERSHVGAQASYVNACVMDAPINDCQPCKRLIRTLQSIDPCPGFKTQADCTDLDVVKELGCTWNVNQCDGTYGTDGLIGFGRVGPVYAMVRLPGTQGYAEITAGTPQTLDEDGCGGGAVTWGRGDGEAYRDLQVGTQGRSQDVCTNLDDGYKPFMQLLLADIATLSAPYPLLEAPIAATIRAGIARPNGAAFDYFEVPRSQTSGFIYNATNNTLGFKNDTLPTPDYIPQSGDFIYVSYKFWRPVKCRDRCNSEDICRTFNDQTSCENATTAPLNPQCEWDSGGFCKLGGNKVCLRVGPCPTLAATGTCTVDTDCATLGQVCVGGNCAWACQAGDFLDLCVCGNCGACEVCDQGTGACTLSTTDPCLCNPRADDCAQILTQTTCEGEIDCAWSAAAGSCSLGTRCVPGGTPWCDPGYTCDEACLCIPMLCTGFNPDGSVNNCNNAVGCCDGWAQDAIDCPALSDSGACAGNVNCAWNTNISACEALGQPCCLPGEEAECYTNPETFDNTIICISIPWCDCFGGGCDSIADCQTWQISCDIAAGGLGAGCSGYVTQGACQASASEACVWDPAGLGTCYAGECTAACNPQTEYCCEACGCECRNNPP